MIHWRVIILTKTVIGFFPFVHMFVQILIYMKINKAIKKIEINSEANMALFIYSMITWFILTVIWEMGNHCENSEDLDQPAIST